MKTGFSKLILLVIIFSMLVPQNLLLAAPSNDSDDEDLSAAFAALSQSMGKNQHPVENDAVDKALEEAFNPVPAPVLNSDIPLAAPNAESPEVVKKAVDTLADTPIEIPTEDSGDSSEKADSKTPVKKTPITQNPNPNDTTPISTEYRQTGIALSLTLWAGGQKTMKNLLTNIVKQVYSDKDLRSFRFIVNSSPVPYVFSRPIDLNEEERSRLQEAEEERENSTIGKLEKYKAKKIDLPELPGVEIRISAGMLATMKTVDELAGQIAMELAKMNKTVYGAKDDPRFIQNQEYLQLINQIIEASPKEAKADISQLRERVLAELSAMERLAAGGFNPWAIQRYERRKLSWMGDVFQKSPNHSLARFLLDTDKYHFDDPTRALRFLLQTSYMRFLQNQERAVGMATQETEFSPKMKRLRLRMKLFVEPFYLGTFTFQLPLLLAGGAAVVGIFNTSVFHWALMAFNQTGGHFEALWHGTAGHIGNLISKVKLSSFANSEHVREISEPILNSGYFGAHTVAAKAAVHDVVSQFYLHYRTLLYGVGGAVLAAGALGFLHEKVVNVMEDVSRILWARQNQRKENAPPPEVEVKAGDGVDKIFQQEMTDQQDQQEEKDLAKEPAAEPENVQLDRGGHHGQAKPFDVQKMWRRWLARFTHARGGVISFFTSMSGKGKVKTGQILIDQGTLRKAGFTFAVDSAKTSETDPQANERLARNLEYLRAPVKGDGDPQVQEEAAQGSQTSWADGFDKWLDKMNSDFAAARGHGIRIAIGIRDRAYGAARTGRDASLHALQIVFIDIPVGAKNATLKQIADAMKYVGDRKDDYDKWRQGAPERARVRDLARQARQAEEDRVAAVKAEQERQEKLKADEADRNEAEQKRLLAEQKAEQKRVRKIQKAEQKKLRAQQKIENERLAKEKAIKDAAQKKIDDQNKKEQAAVQKKLKTEEKFKKRLAKQEKRAQDREAKKQAQEARNVHGNKLVQGEEYSRDFLTKDNLKPQEVYDALTQIFDFAFNTGNHDYFIAEKWGVDLSAKNFVATSRDYFRALLGKWVQTARTSPPTKAEVIAMVDQIAKAYNIQSNKANRVPEFLDNALAAYQLLLDSLSPVERLNLGKWALGPQYQLATGDESEFFQDMDVEKQARVALETKSRAKKAMAIVNAGKRTANEKIESLYSHNEEEMVAWMAAPETRREDIRKFFMKLQEYIQPKAKILVLGLKHRFASAVARLNPIQKVKLSDGAKDENNNNWANAIATKGTLKSLSDAYGQLAHEWVAKSKTIRELVQNIEADCARYQISTDDFKNYLRDDVVNRTDLFVEKADVDLYAEKEYFWPTGNNTNATTVLEQPLVDLLDQKRKEFNDSPAWKYDPIWSEKMHQILRSRLEALGQFPTQFKDLEATWNLWTSRGVSTVTDEILGELLKKGTSEQIDTLEKYAVKEGRVFDQGLRDEFAVRQIMKSPEYAALMKPRVVEGATLPALAKMPGTNRTKEIEGVIRVSQTYMQDVGMRYGKFLEDLSTEIQSTYPEAKLIQDAKAQRIIGAVKNAVDAYSDSRVKMLKDILPYIKKWKPKNQYKLLLYLRGSIEAKDFPFIERQFPRFGPERIRKMYQGLPIEGAMLVTHLYLQETLLSRGEVDQGYGKKLIKFLVSSATDEETREHAAELLDALLYGIDKSGSKEFQMNVLSALIAMQAGKKASIGETIKLILEQFPGVGPKIGQFMVATELLSDDINEVLKDTQDKALPPKRIDVYSDLFDIVGEGRDLGITLEDLLGSGSLKYTVKAREAQTQKELALQVFRQDVQNNSDLQIKILNYAIDRLVKKDRRNAFLRVIVDGAMSAVAREKRYDLEAEKTNYARKNMYSQFSDDEFDVGVPVQVSVNKRLLQSKFAPGHRYDNFTKEDAAKIALKILSMEAHILYMTQPDADGLIKYDTDRHPGNYLVDVVETGGKKRYKLSPIDFGQLTSINIAQRDKIPELFAYAAMLENVGANDWLTREVAKLFGVTGVDYEEFAKNIKAFFPGDTDQNSKKSTVKSYFNLIAAVNEALHKNDQLVEKGKLKKSALPVRSGDLAAGKLDLAYTDFVRAIVTQNQYEDLLNKVYGHIPEEAQTARKILESRAKDILADKLQKLELSPKQNLYIKLVNDKRQLESKLTGKEYDPIKIRLTRAELEQYSIFNKKGFKAVAQGPSTARGIRGSCRLLLDAISSRMPTIFRRGHSNL